MMDNIKYYDKFYEVLFEPHEKVCWSYDIYGTGVSPVGTARQHLGANFFSINPLLGGRLDANVTCFRNILIEFDELPLNAQRALLDTVPWSTVVFSGKKSYHAIISLQTPCETREEYDLLVRRILSKLPDADTSTKNPSRFSRAPMATRDGVEQKLVSVGQRVAKGTLELWLGPQVEVSGTVIALPRASGGVPFLRGSTQYFLGYGAPEGSWNRELFMATLDMARAGHTSEYILLRLEGITGKLDKTDKRTIKSALTIAAKEST